MREYDAEGNLSAAATVTDAGVTEAAGTLTLNSPDAFSVTESTPMGGMALSGPSRLDTVGSISLQSFEDAQRAINTIDGALASVSGEQADYGAIQNRFMPIIDNLGTGSENASAARSRIRDADYAKETAEQLRANLLQQVDVAIQTQANQDPHQVLSLLR
jgi:flagellin